MKKNILIIAISIVGLVTMGYVGLNGLGKMIYKERSCSFANIDNIELHTRVNIPKIIHSDCNYNPQTLTKTSTFTLDLSAIDWKEYLVKNQFKTFKSNTSLDRIDTSNIAATNTWTYYKTETTSDSSSEVLLDVKSGLLTVSILYKN